MRATLGGLSKLLFILPGFSPKFDDAFTFSHRMKLLGGGRSIQPCGRGKRNVYTAMRNTNGWVRTAGEFWCESCCDVRFKERAANEWAMYARKAGRRFYN